MNKIFVDTREKPHAIEGLTKQIEEKGYELVRNKLYAGDYQLLANPFLVVDRKQSLQEVIGNVTHDHKRFKAELQRAQDAGIHVVVLVEHSSAIKCIDDIRFWRNPRLKESPNATNSETLIKILKTMERVYDVEFMFCSKKETGNKIIEILEKGVSDDG